MGGAGESVTKSKQSKGSEVKLHGLRHHISNDEVHVHDDAKALRFVWPGTLSFRIHWREFLAMRGRIKEGERCALIGSTNDPKKRDAAMVAERNRDGELELYLESFDPKTSYSYEIRKNDVVETFTKWVEENC